MDLNDYKYIPIQPYRNVNVAYPKTTTTNKPTATNFSSQLPKSKPVYTAPNSYTNNFYSSSLLFPNSSNDIQPLLYNNYPVTKPFLAIPIENPTNYSYYKPDLYKKSHRSPPTNPFYVYNNTLDDGKKKNFQSRDTKNKNEVKKYNNNYTYDLDLELSKYNNNTNNNTTSNNNYNNNTNNNGKLTSRQAISKLAKLANTRKSNNNSNFKENDNEDYISIDSENLIDNLVYNEPTNKATNLPKLPLLKIKQDNPNASVSLNTEDYYDVEKIDAIIESIESNNTEYSKTGRETDFNTTNSVMPPMRNSNIHEYLYSLANKDNNIGYLDYFKDLKRKVVERSLRSKEFKYKDYKKFKEDQQGFGFDFLDPTRAKEPKEVKIEKQNKRHEYGSWAKERNLRIQSNKKNTYNPEGFKMTSLPELNQDKEYKAIKKLHKYNGPSRISN